LIDPVTNLPVILVPSPAVVLGAIRELLDRAFGRPEPCVEVPPSASDGTARQALQMLTPEDQAALEAIAHRALLAGPHT